MKYLIVIAAMCAVFCLSMGILYLIRRDRIEQQARMRRFLGADGELQTGRAAGDAQPGETRKRLEKLADELYVAGIALRPEEFITIWAVLAGGMPALAVFLGVPTSAAVGLALLGAAAPIALVKMKRNKRLAKFGLQLSDALTVMCNALRAGQSFQTSMQSIATEMEEPISREFGRVFRETQLGMPLETSLNRLVQRTGNQDLDLVCSAVVIQRQIGGNLAQILENISGTINQRIQLRGEIKAMTSSGTFSGYIIGALPVFLLVMLMILNPGYADIFFTTDTGRILLIISVVLEGIGFTIVRKIINIKM